MVANVKIGARMKVVAMMRMITVMLGGVTYEHDVVLMIVMTEMVYRIIDEDDIWW